MVSTRAIELESYGGNIRKGTAAQVGEVHRVRGLAAALVVENQLEIDAPADDVHSIVFIVDPKPIVWSNLLGARRSRALHPGDYVAVPAGLSSSWRTERGGPTRVMHIHFSPSVAADTLEIATFDLTPAFGLRDDVLEGLSRVFRAFCVADEAPARLTADSVAVAFFAAVAERATARTQPLEVARGGLSPRHLRRVLDFLTEDIARDVSIDDLAELVGLSRFHFCRAFRQSVGIPPHRYRIAQRLTRARHLLETTDLSVLEIASQVGYGSASAFTSSFRREVGRSPSAYRLNPNDPG